MPLHFFKSIRRTVSNWWLLLLSGVVLIAIGIWTFMNPQDSYVALAFIFSVSFVVIGLFETVFSINNRQIIDNWGWHLLLGLLTLAVGVLLLTKPSEVSQVVLAFYIGFTVLFRSMWAIGLAIDMRSYGLLNWGNVMVLGILGMLLGFLLIWNPLFAGLSAVVLTGLAFVLGGISNIIISLRLKKLHDLPNRINKELIKRYNEIEKEVAKAMEEAAESGPAPAAEDNSSAS